MLMKDVRPTTLAGVKSLAKQLKKAKSITHSDALELAAKAANCQNFSHAQRALPLGGIGHASPYVLLTSYWSDRKRGYLCGRETLRVELTKPILGHCQVVCQRLQRAVGGMVRRSSQGHSHSKDRGHPIGRGGMRWRRGDNGGGGRLC